MIQEKIKNMITKDSLFPEGVDVSIEIIDNDNNKAYKAHWTFTPEALKAYQELSRERAITSLMIKMFNEELGMQLYAD